MAKKDLPRHRTPAGSKKKNRVSPEFQFIGGRQPVLEALHGTRLTLQKLYLQDGAHGRVIEEIKQAAARRNIPLKFTAREELAEKAAGQNHQGVVALIQPYIYQAAEDLQESFQSALTSGRSPFFLILDHVQDPYNFGSLLRSASCFGVDGVIIPADRACGVTPTVFKASAGALAHLPIVQVVNLAREVERLKKAGCWVMGAEMDGQTLLDQVDFAVPMALVLGSEGKGLSRLLREKCDVLLSIPMQGPLFSLNVSVAGGIIMSRVFCQRRREA